MRVTWDERKRRRNYAVHGLDFADVEGGFDFHGASVALSHPAPDGRPRYKAIGFFAGDLATLVFSRLGTEAISLISLRRASRKERKAYAER